MAGTKGKLKDKNRYRKVYPYLRRKPVNEYGFDKNTVIETGYVDFAGSSSESYTFQMSFPAAPSVVAVTLDSSSNDLADVNVYTTSVTTSSVTFGLSSNFTGRLNFQAIYIYPQDLGASMAILNLEQASITFSNESSKTYTFTQSYSLPPIVTAMSSTGNVNVHVENVTNTQATISLSANLSGVIYIHVISRTN